MIPRVIHQIWLGSLLPEQFAAWRETWRVLHPGWELKLWTDWELREQTAFPSLVDRCRLHPLVHNRYSHQSDIFRWEILAREGGVYVDTDFECRKSIEPFVEPGGCFLALQEAPWHPGAYNGALVGAEAGHPAVRAVLARIPLDFRRNDYLSNGPRMVTAALRGRSDVRVLSKALFYPYRWDEMHRRGEDFPAAYAVHHWASKWETSSTNDGAVRDAAP